MSSRVISSFQPSITEWFNAIRENKEAEWFREEDNSKHERLSVLRRVLGVGGEGFREFEAIDLLNPSGDFKKMLDERGSESCAFRLIPKFSGLEKLRSRGLSIKDCYEKWFLKQEIDFAKYRVQVCEDSDVLLWSGVFVVKPEMVFGEVISGKHSQLTQGNTQNPVTRFQFDYRDFLFSGSDVEAQKESKRMVECVRVDSEEKKNLLEKELRATLSNNYLNGYFETTIWPDGVVRFIDFNRVIPRYVQAPEPLNTSPIAGSLFGAVAFSGKAVGNVVKVSEENLGEVVFREGSVLVCENTDVRFLPFMKKASAIVTEKGGILSHASIIARELKKPCIIGVSGAMEKLSEGDLVEVDAFKGLVRTV